MARLDKESFDKLVQIFEEAEYEPRSYSGRFMYGKDCFGVVCSNPVRMIAEVLANVARNAEDPEEVAEVAEKLMEPRQDNMGHDAIVYWPSIEWMD